MKGREAKERLIAFAAGELPPADRTAIDDLLVSDEKFRREASGTLGNCRLMADRLGRLRALVEVDTAVLDEAPGPEPKTESRTEAASPKPLILAIAAAVVAAGVGGWFLFRDDGEKADGVPGTAATVREEIGTDPADGPVGKPTATDEPETARPEVETDTPKVPRPVTVKPGVAMLLPRLIRNPNQANLERIWAALREKPESASSVTSRIPGVTDEKKRAALVLVLAALNDDRTARATLGEILRTDSSALVRRAAAAALGHVPSKDGVKIPATGRLSVRAGKITDAAQRESLLHAAGEERDPAVVAVLVRMLGPSQPEDPGITDRLLELTRSKDADLRRAAISAVTAGAKVEVIQDLVNDTAIPVKDRVPLVAGLARTDRHSQSGLMRLQRLIDGAAEKEIRIAAVEALPSVIVKGWPPIAIRVLGNTGEERDVRLAALGVVEKLGDDKSAVAAIKAAEGDSDEAIRAAAREIVRARARKSEKKD
jgi:hypothetical protein